MKYDAHDSSAAVANPISRCAPYSSTLSYAASSSSASLWSDVASQSSDDTTLSANTSDSDSCDSFCLSNRTTTITAQNLANSRRILRRCETDTAVPAELRQNPRRSAPGSRPGRSVYPPALVRQSDRKLNFVDALVDTSTHLVMAFWPLSSAVCGTELGDKAVLPLRTFIKETLRRSRTSYSTLQVALYYLVLIKPHVPKQNSTTELQADDRHADRALQCGRRMFLAALILACKYLQDRNYSARAWSKISGLNTQEINQNEIAFLFAVKWQLHITEDAFQQFTRLIHKSRTYPQQHTDWKELALKLESNVTNPETLFPMAPANTSTSDLCVLSPRSILNLPQEDVRQSTASDHFTATSLSTPPDYKPKLMLMEPLPDMVKPCDRPVAPVSNLMKYPPSPRLTPPSPRLAAQFCTPAVSAASRLLARSNAMGLAMAQASSVAGTRQTNRDRFAHSSLSSPGAYCPAYCPVRRSSLANSISTTSSPESMVPDSLHSSRSSSISSASSLASATLYNSHRGSVPLRSRVPKLRNDRASSNKPSVPSVPEDIDENCMMAVSSPDVYHESETKKLGDLSLNTPPVARGLSVRDMVVCDAAADAAKALQELHHDEPCCSTTSLPTTPTNRKRNRASSVDINNHLHDNVRNMLMCDYDAAAAAAAAEPPWSDPLTARAQPMHDMKYDVCLPTSSHGAFGHGVKRVCCATEAASGYQVAGVHAAADTGGGRVWDSILNN
ncbi:hypothetical protein E4U55_008223 [Claviceps digitariae]|nr:hypothetical protein E4U55_008223 [Claviceps digitariae]